MRKLVINAKCSDLCNVEYYKDGKPIIESNGYAPDFPGICGGDYIDIEIDLDTGKIIGFDPISHEDVMLELGEEGWEDDDDDEENEFDEDGWNKNPSAPTQIDPNKLDSSINDMLKDY